MKAKQGTKTEGTCPKHMTGHDKKSLDAYRREYCKGYNHLDLADETVKNVALVHISKDIRLKDSLMDDLARAARFRVNDQCRSPMFSSGDISLQKVQPSSTWVGLVLLDSASEGGYIRRELPQCKSLPYLPSTEVNVKVFVDTGNCCEDTKDAGQCKSSCIVPVNHFHTKQHLEYEVSVKGTLYSLSRGHGSRRRRLLQYRHGGC